MTELKTLKDFRLLHMPDDDEVYAPDFSNMYMVSTQELREEAIKMVKHYFSQFPDSYTKRRVFGIFYDGDEKYYMLEGKMISLIDFFNITLEELK